MSERSGPALPGCVAQTNVAVWGVGAWSDALTWGAHDPRQGPLSVDRYGGTAYWGRQCWVTDAWVRW